MKDAGIQVTMQVWKGHFPASVMTTVQLFFQPTVEVQLAYEIISELSLTLAQFPLLTHI